MSVTIQPVTTIAECRHLETLQKEIWASTDLEVAPDHLLFTIAKEGGLVLLASTEVGEPVGFAYGFLSRTDEGRLKLASHQAGVLPDYQDHQIGLALKLAQREHALEQGLDLITWTFDPLQGRNAYFNLHKLGAVSNTYLPNLYGQMRNELNQGLPSDRFRVDWWLASARVVARVRGDVEKRSVSAYPLLNASLPHGDGVRLPPATVQPLQTAPCLVEIPGDINRLKTKAPDAALRWQRQTRQIFEEAFATGYTAIDLLRAEGRNYYLLEKDITP